MEPHRTTTPRQTTQHADKLLSSHLGKLIVANNRPRPTPLALDDITRRRLRATLPVNAMFQINIRAQRRRDFFDRGRRVRGQNPRCAEACDAFPFAGTCGGGFKF